MDGWHGDGGAGGTTALWDFLHQHPRILAARELNRTQQSLVETVKEARFFHSDVLYHTVGTHTLARTLTRTRRGSSCTIVMYHT